MLKALSLNPSYAGIYGHLASLYYETKRYEKAVAASRKLIELGEDGQVAYDGLLAHLCRARHYYECLKTCDEVLVKFPDDASAFFFRAISKNELGSFAKRDVLSDLTKAHILDPLDSSIKELYEMALAGKSIKLPSR